MAAFRSPSPLAMLEVHSSSRLSSASLDISSLMQLARLSSMRVCWSSGSCLSPHYFRKPGRFGRGPRHLFHQYSDAIGDAGYDDCEDALSDEHLRAFLSKSP